MKGLLTKDFLTVKKKYGIARLIMDLAIIAALMIILEGAGSIYISFLLVPLEVASMLITLANSDEQWKWGKYLVQNLLKITKLDAGTITLEKSIQYVADMMEYVKRHFSYQAQQQEKTLILSGDDEITLFCDQTWLIEAVSNLVKNAIDHTKAGATISISWRAFASVIQIIVSDNGSGIHPEDLPHIFKRFYRSRFSKDTQGIGLGLPLAKAIIEAHNGTIEVDSTLGVGTTFTINFLIPTKL